MAKAKSRSETPSARVQKIRLCYRFLLAREEGGTTFLVDDLAQVTGWKPGTISTYLKKKWGQIVHKGANGFRVTGLGSYTEDEFVRLMSQKDEVSADPKRPHLQPAVESLVRKARESALLALQIYNSPATIFRTEGFAVLMVIGWTALFHAIFEKRNESYFYTESDGVTPKMVDGDRKAWELDTCLKKYWDTADHAIRRNLDFFIRLRNRVEHRYVPSIDPHVAGECQALLLNFDELLSDTFGTYFAIRETLAVPLQTSTLRTAAQSDAVRKLQAKHFDDVKQFIDGYRSGLPDLVYGDQRYSFRVYLVPKVGNHKTSSDLAVEFVKLDSENADEFKQLQKQIVAIREKHVTVANANLLKAKEVVKQVAAQLGKPFNRTHHTRAWGRYGVRKAGKFDPTGCDTRYCVADPLHQDFGYTSEWVVFLVKQLTDPGEYAAITASRTA